MSSRMQDNQHKYTLFMDNLTAHRTKGVILQFYLLQLFIRNEKDYGKKNGRAR